MAATVSENRARGLSTRRPRLLIHLLAAAVAATGLIGLDTAPVRAESTFNARMLELINQARAAAGVGPVVAVDTLNGVAEGAPWSGCGYSISGRAVDMGMRHYFSHTIANCGDKGVFDMLGSTGLSYRAAGENIGWLAGTTDPRAAAEGLHNGYMNSPGHRANVLDARFNAVGIGSWMTPPGQTWSGAGSPRSNVTVNAVVFAQMTVAPPPPPPPVRTPDAPAWVASAPANGIIEAAWAGVPDPPGGPVQGYGVFVFDANGYTGRYTLACATCRNAAIAGLRNGTYYLAAIAAYNSAGWGTPAYTGWIVPGTPTAPRNVTATAVGSGAMDVTWSAPGLNNGAAIQAYAALAYDANGFSGHYTVTGATARSARITGLTPGRSYYLVVLPYNANGWGVGGATTWLTAR